MLSQEYIFFGFEYLTCRYGCVYSLREHFTHSDTILILSYQYSNRLDSVCTTHAYVIYKYGCECKFANWSVPEYWKTGGEVTIIRRR